MLKKSITYTDFNDVDHTEDFYFNLSKRELAEMEVVSGGTMREHLQSIIDSKDPREILKEFKTIITSAYGVRSDDGALFTKSDAATERFAGSGALDSIVLDFFQNPQTAIDFVNGILPADLVAQQAENNAVNGFRPGADTTPPTPPAVAAPSDPAPVVQPEAPAAPVADTPVATPAPVVDPTIPAPPIEGTPEPIAPEQPTDPSLTDAVDTNPEDAANAPSDDTTPAPSAPVDAAPDASQSAAPVDNTPQPAPTTDPRLVTDAPATDAPVSEDTQPTAEQLPAAVQTEVNDPSWPVDNVPVSTDPAQATPIDGTAVNTESPLFNQVAGNTGVNPDGTTAQQ